MQIIVAKNIGFCFGVENAVKTAKTLLEKGFKVFTDDDIVHNKLVMNELKNLGLLINQPGEIFLVRAHGLPKEKIQLMSEKYKIKDLTCRIVYNLFKKAENLEKEGYKIIVFGKPDHPEMVALKSYAKNSIISLEPVSVNTKKIAILSQTTMSEEEFKNFVEKTSERSVYEELLVEETICNITILREKETMEIAKKVDILYVVGGKHSSNTKKLARIASKFTKVFHIETENEIDDIPSNVEKIGVVSGTSTPYDLVNKVVNRIKELGGIQ
ncbi:MAG: hypothetical protein PWP54_1061 [Thermosipho sp. (in: thermotogales)]|nr:hypothetical protein [Thermosipho sp. (in: thermotogales)]MDN5325120.1 hypothetical protein [Thermosipho sp. (in: thermotogales)]